MTDKPAIDVVLDTLKAERERLLDVLDDESIERQEWLKLADDAEAMLSCIVNLGRLRKYFP